ncbi:MAG: hypothetical protein IJP95_00880 [Bacteroidales bacterium]|nr:hypothetical protein [Bacteroidales bacterium]
MSRTDTISAFAELGRKLQGTLDDGSIDAVIDTASHHNPWHTRENIEYALGRAVHQLEQANLKQWLAPYPTLDNLLKPKTIAVVMGGDVPLAGWNDFVSVLASGNRILIKLSDEDDVLIPHLAKMLITVAPEFEDYVAFAEGRMHQFDAIIASGSGSANRYFERYFANYPNIIRQPKYSIAVLDGNETQHQLSALADDIFIYMGLGSRSVSKLMVPEDYNFEPLIKAAKHYRHLMDNNHYKSNLDYHEALLMLNAVPFVDGDFWVLKADEPIPSPVSVANYGTYNDIAEVREFIENNADNLDIVVSNLEIGNAVPFGKANKTELWDYPQGIDTMDFLINL